MRAFWRDKNVRALLLALCLSLFSPTAHALPACGEESGARETCEKDWTVLIYMAATEDLLSYALADLNEMEAPFARANRAASSRKLDLLVQLERAGQAPERRRMVARPGEAAAESFSSLHSPVLENADTASSPAARFSNFLRWGAARYPARHYFVVFWGHGQGWRGSATDPFGGLLFNERLSGALSIPDLRAGLAALKNQIGRPVDVYASDSCYMQMVEVAYELKDEARFVVGSTQAQNFLGLPYRRLLYEMNTGSFNGARDGLRGGASEQDEAFLLARMVPGLTRQSLDPTRGSQGRTQPAARGLMTASSLASAEIEAQLLPALRRLGQALAGYLEEDRLRAIDLQLVLQNFPAIEGGAQDAGLFLSLLDAQLRSEDSPTKGVRELSQAIADTQRALSRTIVAEAYGERYGIDQARQQLAYLPRVLSLWLPPTRRDYESRREDFFGSRFYREAAWNRWLDLLYLR